MPNLIGPSHHFYYASLHRRRLWLGHLAHAFDEFADLYWPQSYKDLARRHSLWLSRLSVEGHLGIQHPLPLAKILDDTPVESFLSTLADGIDGFEAELMMLMHKQARAPEWIDALEQTSMLWGREIAQECLIVMTRAKAPAAAMPHGASVKGLFQIFNNVLQGGDFSWKPLLLRRCTEAELHYELRRCAHRRGQGPAADTACRLESMVHSGFASALLEGVHFQRHSYEQYCVDELSIK